MTLTRWNRPELGWPLGRLSELHREIDRLFQSPLASLVEDGTLQPFRSGWCPALDVYEDANHLYVRAELPGMKKEQIELSLQEGMLTLAGERSQEQSQSDAEIYRSERLMGRFHRTLTLPVPVEADKVKATYQDGILTVTMPKAEAAKPKQIQVKSS